jgi:hypothetical protein
MLRFWKKIQVDSFIADIPEDEEVQDEEWRVERQVFLQHYTFDMYNESEIWSNTRFSYSALPTLEDFCGLPPVMYLRPSDLQPRQPNKPRQGCHLIHDEELILVCLHRFAHGVSIAVIADKFGDGVDKWVYAFAYFCRHVHGLVYPGLIGLEYIRFYVPLFSSFARPMELASNQPRIWYNNDHCEVTIIPGVEFPPGSFAIVGLFDCRHQQTSIPDTGPSGNRGRNHVAYLMQRAVYSGY